MRRTGALLLSLLLAATALFAAASPASAAPNEIVTWGSPDFSSPNGLLAGPNGFLWSADFEGGIQRFNPATGGFKRWDWLEGSQAIADPILGPDGNLWFGANSGLVQFDPTDGSHGGVVGANVNGAAGLLLGPDGAIWFASQFTDRIGRHLPGGVVSTYANANVDQPNDLAVGGDGAIWFTSLQNDRIGRIDPTTFAITTFTDPQGEVDFPSAITADLDGDLWFTSSFNDRIGRLDPATGDIVTFTHPDLDAPRGIAAGPDGHLWFGTADGHLGRANRYTGAITLFADPDGEVANVADVIDGPGDHVWFTSYDNGRIGRIELPRCAGRVVTSRVALGEGASLGNDVILGTPAANTIVALGGNDRVCGGGGADKLYGSTGADVLEGGGGDDTLSGGDQRDLLRGGPGRDHLLGGPQRDRCFGGPQPDTSATCEVRTSIP